MATSAAGIALRRHVIPLVSHYNELEEGKYTTLSRYVNIGCGNTEKQKYNVPLVSTQDAETLCRYIFEFIDVSAVQRLSLTTGPLRFTFS